MIANHLEKLLIELTRLTEETEWVEFKINKWSPEDIGKYISAISNSSALHGRETGYIVWGVENSKHTIIGTTFKPRQEKVGNEALENWLVHWLYPRIDFRIHEFNHNGKQVVIFEIPRAIHTPVRFKDCEYIRIGSYTKKLRDHPEKERSLWHILDPLPFEDSIALTNLTVDQVLSLIDYPAFFDVNNLNLPDNSNGIIEQLKKDGVIKDHGVNKKYDIKNLGAILYAKDLRNFDRLARKTIRVIQYRNSTRLETIKEQEGRKGYAIGFEGLIEYINDRLPQNEEIQKALRKEVKVYPEIAVRELVANTLIHQDFTMRGTGPTVEIFNDRIEITNPGTPLIDTMRFIDSPPVSRNEKLASKMRYLNICEERGSGIDKVITYVELFQLPPPDFQVINNHTKAILFALKQFSDMDTPDRIRACYQHAVLCWVSNKNMTNSSLRKRFGIAKENSAIVSRIIKDTCKAGLIKPVNPESTSRKHARYIPFWV